MSGAGRDELLLPLLAVAATLLGISCTGSVEKAAGGNLEDPRRQAELRGTYRRELRLCEAFGEQQMPTCLLALAVEKREPFLCSEIPEGSSWRSECYRKVAALTGQSILCGRIGPPSIQARCYAAAAAVSRDAASCTPILAADRERKKKESALPAIEVGSTEWNVDANYKACVAVAQGNADGCEAINKATDSDARRLCFQELALSKEDPALCARLQTEGSSIFVHDCIKEIGIRTAQATICEQIPSQSGAIAFQYRRECSRSVDLFTRTGVKCEERDPLCSGRIAAVTHDLTVCRNLRSYTEIDNCLITYAYKAGDGAVCSEMRDSGHRSICQEVAGSAGPKAAPDIQAAKPPQPAPPDGRAEARRRAETAERDRWEAALYWSRVILENLGRIDRRSEEHMRIDLLKADASESSPTEVLIRLRSSEIVLKMRWCDEGDIPECIAIGEELFRSCQFNQAEDVFLRAKKQLDNTPRALDGHIFEGDVRQTVEVGVNKSDPSHRSESCATYALGCCGSTDAREAALWERLWNEYRRNANVAFSGLPIQEGMERLWLSAVRGELLRKQYEFVLDLENLDAETAKPVREAFVEVAQRHCNEGGAMSCRVLTESYLGQCRFDEAAATYRKMMDARAAEIGALGRIERSGKAREILRQALEKVPGGLSDPATFSAERRALCEQMRRQR
ncbi:MAG TPA: hypothetical protein VER58_03655 [Thermoanaerobaculia bacterium]|nr:hypothetical protein [Thermoanaerobaculia bacterium]